MGSIDKMVSRAVEICNDDSIGYSQRNRWLNPDVDCSSMMYIVAGSQGGGYLTRWGSGYTGTMLDDFKKAGFTVIPFSSLSQLVKGDILLNVANHTELYIGNNQFAGAHIDENGTVHGWQGGDQTGREVSIGAAYVYSRGWDYILRPSDSKGSQSGGTSGSSGSNSGVSGSYNMVQTGSGNWRNDATTNSGIFATYDSGAQVSCVGFVYGQDPYGDGRNRWVKSKNNGKFAWEGLFSSSAVDKLPHIGSGSTVSNSGNAGTSGNYIMVQTGSGNWRNDATTNSGIFATYDSRAQVSCVGFVYGQDPYGDGRNRWVKSKNNSKFAWEGLFSSSAVDKLPQL